MATRSLTIDRTKSTERIERDIETLAGADYTRSSEVIRRYAYTPEYRNALDYFVGELEALGFEHYEDPVGTLVARNRPADAALGAEEIMLNAIRTLAAGGR